MIADPTNNRPREWANWLLRELGVPTRRAGRPGAPKADGVAIYQDLARKRWLCA